MVRLTFALVLLAFVALAICLSRFALADRPTTQTTAWAATQEAPVKTEVAEFASGCFWGSEATFRKIPGVITTEVGFEGGITPNPTYRMVCTHSTGYAETVRVTFDPATVSYQKLLEVFFESHDPTTVDRQGPDEGDQYRSEIFYHSDEQKKLAEAEKDKRDASGEYVGPIVTKIEPAIIFYKAEDYHQQYFEKQGVDYSCHLGDGKKH